jgi:uncharacterized protein
MLKFLAAYLLIYAGTHAVFFHRFRVLLPANAWTTLFFGLFLACMVIAPIISRILEIKGHDPMARALAFVTYFWMGYLFLAFSGCLVLYLLDFLSWAMRTFFGFSFPRFGGRMASGVLAALCLVLTAYGYVLALKPAVVRLSIDTEKLPPSVKSLRIVQISDVHIGIINRDKRLEKIIHAVKALDPDLLVCTGDLVDGSMQNLMHLSDFIKQVKPPYGKYAVTGNHEYFAGLEHSLEFMEKAGFDVLRGEVRTVGDILVIAGVDDGGRLRKPVPDDILSQIDQDRFVLYLKHRPEIGKNTPGKFDLQLSGHTHNGQIFPFHFLVEMEFPYIQGYYGLAQGSALYVSRGSGTWGPPIRLFSGPEITLIEIFRAKSIHGTNERVVNASFEKKE